MLARCAKMAEERETGTTLGIPPPPPSMASIPLPPRLQGLPGSIPPAPPLGFGSIPPPPNLNSNRDGSPSPGELILQLTDLTTLIRCLSIERSPEIALEASVGRASSSSSSEEKGRHFLARHR